MDYKLLVSFIIFFLELSKITPLPLYGLTVLRGIKILRKNCIFIYIDILPHQHYHHSFYAGLIFMVRLSMIVDQSTVIICLEQRVSSPGCLSLCLIGYTFLTSIAFFIIWSIRGGRDFMN